MKEEPPELCRSPTPASPPRRKALTPKQWGGIGIALLLAAVMPMPLHVTGIARVVPSTTLTIEALTVGELKEVHRNEGDFVHKGDVLATIHNGDYESELAQSNKEIEVINKQIQQLAEKRDYLAKALARDKDLHDEKVIAITELEQTELDYNQTVLEFDIKNKKLEGLKVRIAFLQEELAHSQVTAPIDGTILGPIANMRGKWLSKGSEMCQIFDPTSVLLEFPVYENQVRNIAVGQKAHVRFIAFDSQGYDGQVQGMLPVAWEKLEKVWVKENVVNVMIKTETTPSGLKPGMTAKVKILCGRTLFGKWLIHALGF